MPQFLQDRQSKRVRKTCQTQIWALKQAAYHEMKRHGYGSRVSSSGWGRSSLSVSDTARERERERERWVLKQNRNAPILLHTFFSADLSLSLNLVAQAHKCCCSRISSLCLCVLNDCCCLRAFCAPKMAATTTDTAAGGVDMQLKPLARTSMAAPRGGPTGHSY